MGIPLGLSMVTPGTAKNLVLDAGVGYYGINMTILRSTGSFLAAVAPSATWTYAPTGKLITPRPLGATKDDTTVKTGRTMRDVELNSIRGPMMDLKRITNTAPTIMTSLAEFGDYKTALMAFYGTLDYWPNESNPSYAEVTPGLTIETENFIPNIAIAASVSGKEQPVLIVLENCLPQEDPELALKDDNELGVPITFAGHFSLEHPNAPPIHYFFPVETGSGSGS